jgi:hypothetical protein
MAAARTHLPLSHGCAERGAAARSAKAVEDGLNLGQVLLALPEHGPPYRHAPSSPMPTRGPAAVTAHAYEWLAAFPVDR